MTLFSASKYGTDAWKKGIGGAQNGHCLILVVIFCQPKGVI